MHACLDYCWGYGRVSVASHSSCTVYFCDPFRFLLFKVQPKCGVCNEALCLRSPCSTPGHTLPNHFRSSFLLWVCLFCTGARLLEFQPPSPVITNDGLPQENNPCLYVPGICMLHSFFNHLLAHVFLCVEVLVRFLKVALLFNCLFCTAPNFAAA